MKPKAESQIKTKNIINTLKIVSVFLIIGFIFVGLSFAQDTSTQKVDDWAKITHFLVSFLSRGRALLATLAGKLMSNDLIYGSFMHLDIFLWKTRNIMKNFANYILGFLFLYMVIKSIIDKDGASDIIKKKLVGFILAGVLIQASWFLIGAVVDISTIAVTAIGAVPGQILQSDIGLQRDLAIMNAGGGINLPSTSEIKTGIVMTFDPNKELVENGQSVFITKEEKALDNPITQNNYLDMILPSYNTISGPLLFFGISIFQFQDYSFSNPETTTSRKRLMEFALNLLIILIYSLAMFALVIINFFRIFFLWVIIIFSPFIVLLSVFTKMGILPEIESLKSASIGNILKLIFKPVIFMAYISIMMIFVIGVRAILVPVNGGEVKINDEITVNSREITNGAGGKSYNSSIKSDGIFNFSVNGAKNSIAELIVYFVTLFLLRFLLKAAISSGSGMKIIDDKLNGMTDSAEKIAGQVPIVPIAGGVGVNSILGSDGLINKAKENISGQMSEQNLKKMKQAFPKLYSNYGTNYDLEKAALDTANPEKFWNDAQSFAYSNGGISYNGNSEGSREWTKSMQTRFDSNKNQKPVGWIRENNGMTIDNLDKFIELNASKIDEKMGGKGKINNKIDELEKQKYGVSKNITESSEKEKEEK